MTSQGVSKPLIGRDIIRSVGALALAALLVSVARADGAVSGHVTVPEGTTVSDIRLTLIPEQAKVAKKVVKVGKKGDYFFAMLPEGRYTIGVEGTDLVPVRIKVLVLDTEKHSEVLNYDGPAPTDSQPFDVGLNLKTTYDLTLGRAGSVPKAQRSTPSGLGEIPGLIQAGDFQGAADKASAAIAADPNNPDAHYLRALALFKLKDYSGAQTSVQKTIELKPDKPGAHWLAGATLASLGKKAEAVEEFQKEIDNPQTEPATRINSQLNVGLIERELEHKPGAIAAFEKLLELDPSQAEAYSYLAELYLATGQPAKAAEIEAKAHSAGVEDPNALYNLGATYWNSKDYAKAEEYFRRATAADPKFAIAWERLGYALVNLGRTDEAVPALSKYLELSPDAKDASEVRDLINALKK